MLENAGETNIVCTIKCKGCDSTYVGQTNQYFVKKMYAIGMTVKKHI